MHEFVHTGEKIRLDRLLCDLLPGRSRSFVQKLIDEGWVDLPDIPQDREIKPSMTVLGGTTLRITIPPARPTAIEAEDIPLTILHEDEHLAVIEKPPGLVVHPSPHQVDGTLVNALLHHLDDLSGIGGEERPGIVHRLDRFTSGVLVIAKNDRAHQALSHQFKERTVEKTYQAIVRGQWTARQGSINLPIGRSYLNRKRMMVRTDGRGRESVTAYEIREEFDGYALIEVRPTTGRTHQIRVHMAKIRLPVACDGLYGREKAIYRSELMRRPRESGETPLLARQALHAHRLRFTHPATQEAMTFEAPLPADMRDLLEALREHRAPT